MVDSKYLPSNEEFTKAHQDLHTALIKHFKTNLSVLSKELYNSSYFQIEGTEKRFFYDKIRFGIHLDAFLEYLLEAKEQEIPLVFRKKEYEFDIWIPSVKLDVEVDGASHKRTSVQLKDEFRDKLLREQGITVFRVKNEDLTSIEKIDHVVQQIDELVQDLYNVRLSRRGR